MPGKLLYTADTRSRSPVSSVDIKELALQDEAELFAAVAISNLPASTKRADVYKVSKSKIPLVLRLQIAAKGMVFKT